MVSYPQAQGFTDVVVTVNWSCNGTDGTYNGAVSGLMGVRLDPNAPYTPYADLTEEQVVGWVKASLGEDQVIATQNDVAQQIANNYYTLTILPNPWG